MDTLFLDTEISTWKLQFYKKKDELVKFEPLDRLIWLAHCLMTEVAWR